MSVYEIYRALHQTHLQVTADGLRSYIVGILDGIPHIDAVSARAKNPERLKAKSEKKDDDGAPKYTDPLNQVQDMLGARIIVLYLSDVKIVQNTVLRYLYPIEVQTKQPLSDSEFGYVGEHFILRLPSDVIPDDPPDYFPEFFELQVKTLFQHAWSEAHHDLGYKSARALTSLEKRKVAFTAAQAWGADTIFEELAQSLGLEA